MFKMIAQFPEPIRLRSVLMGSLVYAKSRPVALVRQPKFMCDNSGLTLGGPKQLILVRTSED